MKIKFTVEKPVRYTGIESIDKSIEKEIYGRIEKEAERVMRIKYFKPREFGECNKLIPEVKDILKNYKNALIVWYRNSWTAAEKASFDAGKDIIGEFVLYEAFDVIRSNVSDVIRNALFFNKKNRGYNLDTIVEKASTDIAMYVIWKSVLDVANDNSLDDTISYAVKYFIRNIKGYEKNPFKEIFKFYEMSLYPKGFREVNRVKKFFVDFPLTNSILGCWMEDDDKISYMHKWDEDCSKRRKI